MKVERKDITVIEAARAHWPSLAQLLLFPLRNELAQESTNPPCSSRDRLSLYENWVRGVRERGGNGKGEEAYVTLIYPDLHFPAPTVPNLGFSRRKLYDMALVTVTASDPLETWCFLSPRLWAFPV